MCPPFLRCRLRLATHFARGERSVAGKVVLTPVQPGDAVEEGQTLVIIEATKMENELRASGPATVDTVLVQPGDTVEPGTVLVEFVVE